MIVKEFGDKSKPVIILLHGGGLSWWSWKVQIEALQKEYFVVAPIIDGHGDAFDTDFVSIESSAGQVVQYIEEKFCGHVFAICGLSLGAQITVEILSREADITEYALIESALVCPIETLVKLTVPMFGLFFGFIKKRWFAKLQAKSMKLPDGMFRSYYTDTARMTKESLIQMTKSNGTYTMPAALCNTKAKVLILVGEKELPVMKKSAKLLNGTIGSSSLIVMKKFEHGEISLANPQQYIGLMKRFFEADRTEVSSIV